MVGMSEQTATIESEPGMDILLEQLLADLPDVGEELIPPVVVEPPF